MNEKKRSSKEVQQTFLLSFIGEYVNVVTDIMITDFATSEESQMEQNAPMVSRGYMLDCDSDYLYLGEDPFEITQAVQRKRIVLIQREIKNSAYTEMLNNMADPKKKEDIN
jgi:hypothetical protein